MDETEVSLKLNRREATVLLQCIRIRQDEHKHIVEATKPGSPNNSLYKALDVALEQLKMKIAGQI